MADAVAWISRIAAQRGLRYEVEPDERWLRAWEPYTTLKVPVRYEHALYATGAAGSLSLARAVVDVQTPSAKGVFAAAQPAQVATWLAIVQDVRLSAQAAVTSDFNGIFGEPLELVALSLERHESVSPDFNRVFASFAVTPDALRTALTPSLCRLLLSWRVPVHLEFRPGGFIFAPVSVVADERGLSWMLEAIHLIGEKATKSTL